MNPKPVCIIPARGGSKRVHRKNIRQFNGKPLIAWPIETAIKSGIFSDVIVSTDDREIADISKKHGASIPFMRSSTLADDHTTTADVLKDALARIDPIETTCCLYPTAPLITSQDLKSALELLINQNVDAVISITDFDFHPLRAFSLGKSGTLSFKWPEYELTRSQDLPQLSHDAGAFYFFKTESFIQQGKLVMKNTIGYHLERMRALDIDTEEDFNLAEKLHGLTFGR